MPSAMKQRDWTVTLPTSRDAVSNEAERLDCHIAEATRHRHHATLSATKQRVWTVTLPTSCDAVSNEADRLDCHIAASAARQIDGRNLTSQDETLTTTSTTHTHTSTTQLINDHHHHCYLHLLFFTAPAVSSTIFTTS